MEKGRVPPPPPPPPTTILGKYQLGRLLGRGSFAKVYRAHSIADGSAVALKIIDKAKTVDAAMEPRIVREVSAMKRLKEHPNILKIHEVMATKTKIYLVMELATGGELFSKISGGRKLKESAVRRYLQQIVSALSFCHQNSVAHRDLKPQNLLLDQNGTLKVADFGLSALPEQLRNGLLHTACGTPAYTAPEVVGRRGYDGSKADAWSCGVILFILLAGRLPFDDSNINAMYKKIRGGNRDYLNYISSKPLRSLIFKLLDPNPNTRLSLENLKQHPWMKKSLPPQPESSLFESNSFPSKSEIVSGMNAFDIISLSSGLNLSGLFEATNRKEERFTTSASAEIVMEKAKEAGEKLGFRTEKGKGWTVGLGKGRVVLIVELLEIAPSLLLGELKVREGGVEFEESHWENLKLALQADNALSWINDAV